MTRLTTRNVLLVIGVWEASSLVAMLFRVLFIPISNRLIFTGDAGNVEMWLWECFPDALVAVIASIVSVWVTETKKPLLWHYRSRHEHLIAFSNRYFYDGRLITFPSADDTRRAVQYVHVEDGVYSRGANNRFNRVEAKKVVDLVLEHAQKHPRHTLGVITFSEAQMVAVQTEIDARKRANPVLEETLSESGPEGFFVKNLENVQGDERDAIFFSVGYGPDETGKMGMNFGPLNRQGGERRLNVAVTRARHLVTIAASFRPEDIDRERTKAKGTHLLRSYLEYAERGPQALLGEVTSQGGELESPFEEAVATALMARGLSVVSQVGVSGFRIDLAIKDERRDRYLLGIECDGATYHSAKTARDRDRLRQQVLERLGWKIHRIWSTDWIKDPDGEVQKVLQVLESVRDGGHDDPPLGSISPDGGPSEGDGHDLGALDPISLGEERPTRGRATFLTQARDFGVAQTYRYADVPEGRYPPWEFETATREILYTLVLRCVEAEGPVHEDRVARAVASVYGIGRVSARMRDRIRGGIRLAAGSGRVTRRGDFLWPTGVADPPIRAADAEGNVRPIREVAPEELASAIVSLLKTAFAMSRYDLTSTVAREMGYERTGAHVAAAIGGAIDTLVVGEIVLDIGGQLRLAA